MCTPKQSQRAPEKTNEEKAAKELGETDLKELIRSKSAHENTGAHQNIDLLPKSCNIRAYMYAQNNKSTPKDYMR